MVAARRRCAGGGMLLRSATRAIEIEELRKDSGCKESRCAESTVTTKLAVDPGSASPTGDGRKNSFEAEATESAAPASHPEEEEQLRCKEGAANEEDDLDGCQSSPKARWQDRGGVMPTWTLSDHVSFDPTVGRPRRVRTDDWD